MIFQASSIVFLKRNQILYKEEDEEKTLFIILYGRVGLCSRRVGALGKAFLGWTVGEESYVDKTFLCRIENCYADAETAMIELEYEKIKELQEAMIN